MFVGEFLPVATEFSDVKSRISESEILQNSISANQKYFIGAKCLISRKEVNEYVHEELELRFDAKPWQYSWVGSKHKKDTLHTFYVNIWTSRMQLERAGSSKNIKASELQLLHRCQSPSFRIASMRRNNPRALEKKAEQAMQKLLMEDNLQSISSNTDIQKKKKQTSSKTTVAKKTKKSQAMEIAEDDIDERYFQKSSDEDTIEMSIDEEQDLVDDIAQDLQSESGSDSDSSLSDDERAYFALKRSKYNHQTATVEDLSSSSMDGPKVISNGKIILLPTVKKEVDLEELQQINDMIIDCDTSTRPTISSSESSMCIDLTDSAANSEETERTFILLTLATLSV